MTIDNHFHIIDLTSTYLKLKGTESPLKYKRNTRLLFIPHSTTLNLARLPYITYFIIILCLFIYYQQSENNQQVQQALNSYCSNVYDPNSERENLDFLTGDRFACANVINFFHRNNDLELFKKLTGGIQSDSYLSEEQLNQAYHLIEQHVIKFQQSAPVSLDGLLMYYPDSWNPLRMITSAFAHGSWSHVIFNLIFFLAFAAALEILINNHLRYIAIIFSIAIVSSISYSISTLINGVPMPSLGLSGVVMGMIGLSAYLMPNARIKVFVWFLTIVKNVHIPAWILALWYIGWDTWDMFTSDDYNGINIVAHVSGGFAGYLIGYFTLKDRREEIRDELDDEIEFRRSLRSDGNSMSSYHGGRNKLENELKQKQAAKQYDNYLSELYRYVTTDRDSDAVLLIIKDYDFQKTSIEIYEDIFTKMSDWKPSRALLCLGRLIIDLYIEQSKLTRALHYVEKCQNVSQEFVLANPAYVLLLAKHAIAQNQFQLAYNILSKSSPRYSGEIDWIHCKIYEIDLLWNNLNNKDMAREELKLLLMQPKNEYHTQVMQLAKLMQE